MSRSNQKWSLPVNPNASLLSRLYSLLEDLQDAADVLKSWPAETGEEDDQVGTPSASSCRCCFGLVEESIGISRKEHRFNIELLNRTNS